MNDYTPEIDNKEIGKDLCSLANLLITEGVCLNTGVLDSAGNECSKIDSAPWSYTVKKLEFPLHDVGSTIPCEASDIVLTFTTSISANEYYDDEVYDPLNNLGIDIEISGQFYDEVDNKVKEVFCSWHLDKHITTASDGDPKFSHPLYHFSFGGKKMEEKNLDFGATLILPGPRLAYPPMDAVLAIDFIIKNYIHKDKLKKLIENPDYINIVKKAQQRLWVPYIKSFYSYCNEQTNKISSGFNYKLIFPLLV